MNAFQRSSTFLALRFRTASSADIPLLEEAEREWLPPMFRRDGYARLLKAKDCAGALAFDDCEMIGFVIYRSDKKLEIVSLVVCPAARRRSVASRLLALLSIDSHTAYCVVPESNLSGQLFVHAVGFRARRVVRAFWRSSRDGGDQMDGYLFVRNRRDDPTRCACMSPLLHGTQLDLADLAVGA